MLAFHDDRARAQLAALDRSQAIIEFLPDGTIVSANANFLSAMGYTPDEVRGQHHSLFVAPAYRDDPAYQQFWDSLRRGEFQSREFKRVAKGGREVWIQASYNPVRDRRGRIVSIVKFASDITEQKRRSIADAGQIAALNRSQAVIRFTPDGTITDANENFLSVTGYALDEIRGRHHSLFMPREERDTPAYAAFWKALGEGRHQAGEFRRIDKQSREVWIVATYNPVFDADGKPCAVVKFASDITAQVRERQRRIAGQKEIDADLQAITSTTSDVSRQARTAAETASTTSGNVNAVAVGAEEFSASIDELSRHASEAKTASDEAVTRAKDAGTIVSGLTDAADRIGAAVTLIRSIADQTNLLALNATIEAARAGEAGRGFAVVAQEVKALANQSSRATEEIAQQIGAVQGATAKAVDAIGAITRTIGQLSEISLSVSSAVTEQAAVTRDMSNNMQVAAEGVEQVRRNMEGIAQAAQAVDGSVGKVACAARALA